STAFLFPGQGAHFVGMCRRFANDRDIQNFFKRVNELIGYDLLKICVEGPAERLNRTENSQLAVLVASLAALKWHEKHSSMYLNEQGDPALFSAAGFSVGEYSALVFAQALTLSDALKVVSVRAKAMQKASGNNPSGMVTVKGLNDIQLDELCGAAKEWASSQHPQQQETEAVIANYLYPKCRVIACSLKAMDYIIQFGNSKVSRLPVNGAFHSPLMAIAQPALEEALDNVEIRPPAFPVYSNVTGRPYGSVEEVRRLLVQQLVQPVLWHQLVTSLIRDKNPVTVYEAGPGRQLNTILCRIDRRLKCSCHNIEA
ncbi:predicted protein, partial [Nematostella vectensis]